MSSSPRRGILSRIAGSAFLALLVAIPGAAQDSGAVSGAVVDSSGQVVPGATSSSRTKRPRLRAPCPRTSAARSRSALCRRDPTLSASSSPGFARSTSGVLNTVQFLDIDRAAVFNAQGVQTKATFGTAIGIQSPTAPPRVMQLSARFTF